MSSNVEQNVAKAYQSRDASGTKIYMNFGKYDISMLIPRVQKLKTILANKQYTFIYREYPEGHNWRFWEKYLPEALQYILEK
jgi:enterochelin esterase-like enzyme